MSYYYKVDPDKIRGSWQARRYDHDEKVKHLEWARFQLRREIERNEAANQAAPVKIYFVHKNE